jgi:hypothetical protein
MEMTVMEIMHIFLNKIPKIEPEDIEVLVVAELPTCR